MTNLIDIVPELDTLDLADPTALVGDAAVSEVKMPMAGTSYYYDTNQDGDHVHLETGL